MLAEEVVPVDALISSPFELNRIRREALQQNMNIRGFRLVSAAMSACRNRKLCPCLLTLD